MAVRVAAEVTGQSPGFLDGLDLKFTRKRGTRVTSEFWSEQLSKQVPVTKTVKAGVEAGLGGESDTFSAGVAYETS